MTDPSRKDAGLKVPPVELTLRFDQITRKLELIGPMENSILLLMMLEGARIMVTDFKDGKKSVTPGQIVVPAAAGIPRSV